MESSDPDFDYLLERYGALKGISREDTRNMGVRYRHRPVNDVPGLWISREGARRLLELECEKQQSKQTRSRGSLTRDQLDPTIPDAEIDSAYWRSDDGKHFIPK